MKDPKINLLETEIARIIEADIDDWIEHVKIKEVPILTEGLGEEQV